MHNGGVRDYAAILRLHEYCRLLDIGRRGVIALWVRDQWEYSTGIGQRPNNSRVTPPIAHSRNREWP